jgi:hypothetical protein
MFPCWSYVNHNTQERETISQNITRFLSYTCDSYAVIECKLVVIIFYVYVFSMVPYSEFTFLLLRGE